MSTVPFVRAERICLLLAVAFLAAALVPSVPAATGTAAEPAMYLDFNEGSGSVALDASGHGNAGTIAKAVRTESGGCGGALLFNGTGEYVSIPYSPLNHPEKEITVSAWFYVDSFEPQPLVTSYREGGYSLGFGDGNDLWWTISTGDSGLVSIPVQHEGITPRQWHHVTGTYDGQTVKIYLDGALRNRVNATGPIHYEYNNYVLLGANAGTGTLPDPGSSQYLKGGLDEVRIYDTALAYSQVMDDRFRCSAEPVTLLPAPVNETGGIPAGGESSGSLRLIPGESAVKQLQFSDKTENGTWQVSVPAGSQLSVRARDLYAWSYPDSWYIEIRDGSRRVDRSIAFPSTNNAPVEGVITTGNALVTIRYFDGKYRFPASVEVIFECREQPPAPPAIIPPAILVNPGIVIYTASWATLIAILVVVVWLHRRRTARKKEEAAAGTTGTEPPKKDD